MTWTDLNLLHESPVLEDQIVCAIADTSVEEVYDVSLIEIINNKFDWIPPEQVQKFIRNAAKAAISAIDSHRAKNAGEVERDLRFRGRYAQESEAEAATRRYETAMKAAALISTLRSAIAEKDEALKFYADTRRYNGPNQRNDFGDPYSEGPYVQSVERDRGSLARSRISDGAK